MASETSGVGGKEGGRKAYRVAKTEGGGEQGSASGSQVAAGHRHPQRGRVAPGG